MKKYVFYFNVLKMQAMKGMKIWLVMVGLVCAVGAWGQGWMKTYDGNDSTSFFPVGIVRNDGLLFVSGVSGYSNDSYSLLHLMKIDWDGEVAWENTLFLDSTINFIMPTNLVNTPDGGCVIYANASIFGINSSPALIKLDSELDVQWIKTYPQVLKYYTTAIGGYLDGGFLLSATNTQYYTTYLYRIMENGDTIYSKKVEGEAYYDMVIDNDSTTVFVGKIRDTINPLNHHMLIKKIDADGNEIWANSYGDSITTDPIYLIAKRNNGGYISSTLLSNGVSTIFAINSNGGLDWYESRNDGIANGNILQIAGGYILVGGDVNGKIYLSKIDDNGQKIWEHSYPSLKPVIFVKSSLLNQNGNIYVYGNLPVPGYVTNIGNDLFLYKIDSSGILYPSILSGTAHLDAEFDCLPDASDPGLSEWLIEVAGVQSLYTLTDSLGNFTMPVDTGSYTVTITPPGPYWAVCNSPKQVDITAFYDTLSLDFPAQAIADCPYLTVDISAPFLRRCFDNHYYVHYCNDGTATANDATVEVTLDPYFTYISSTLPLASQNGNTLTFDLGDVAVGDCGNFQITAFLDCDSTILGQTHCTSAHISPDSLCIPPLPLWDGSSIEVDASCNGDSVTFTLTNVGTGGMPAPLGFIIIEDQIVLMSGDFQLGPGESTTVTSPSNGTTLHLEAQQAVAHPSGFASTGSTIEGCGGWLSLGFFTQWSFDDDPDPFTDVDCQANIGSFDPNDKQGFPTGLGAPTEVGVIEPGQDIEYLIRFQNTGTDTAFKVTVVDVLPPELDLAAVRPGASSHAYTYGVTPEGWLTFTFDNIQLPDSTTNEPASHGFVRFRASQRPGLGWGNVIANTALIYFDFNAPIQTNTYTHRIGQVFPWTVVGTTPPVFHPKTNVRIVPNPLTDSALLQVDGIEPGPLNLVLTDISGKVLRQQTVNGTGFEFQRGELNPGLYFFKIERNGERVGSGKLMVK